jgi:hypothetical protein
MVRELADSEVDALIARYIEPYPGDPRIGEYRLREEARGYPRRVPELTIRLSA